MLLVKIYLNRLVIIAFIFLVSCNLREERVQSSYNEYQVIFEFYGPFDENNIPVKILDDLRYKGPKNILNDNGILYYLVLLSNISNESYSIKLFCDTTPVIQAYYFNYCEIDNNIDYCYTQSNLDALVHYKVDNHLYRNMTLHPKDTSLFLIPVNSLLLNNTISDLQRTDFQNYSINCFFPQFTDDKAMNDFILMNNRAVFCNSCYYLEQSIFISSRKQIESIQKSLESDEIFNPGNDDLHYVKKHGALLNKANEQLSELFTTKYLDKVKKEGGSLANYNNSLYPTIFGNLTKVQVGDTIFEQLDAKN